MSALVKKGLSAEHSLADMQFKASIVRSSPIIRTPRVQQLEGIFDIQTSEKSQESWDVCLDLPDEYNVGLICGPSGSGKSTIARELFGQYIVDSWEWPADKSIVDAFPKTMPIKDITGLLSSVGFSSPPSWLRPFGALSNGEQFRVTMARTLAESKDVAVVDEFTSVVDRTVAQIGSAAIAKTVRKRGQKFIAVSCHYDIAAWLEPDWIYEPHLNKFTSGRSLRRPEIELRVCRVHHSAWAIFKKHHYLDTKLNPAAACFVAFMGDTPVAFSSWLSFAGISNMRREHRTVTLPDYQGVGIGNALSAYCASMWKALGMRAVSSTGNPAMISSRARSESWRMTSAPALHPHESKKSKQGASLIRSRATNRLTASFEYIGAPMNAQEAKSLFGQ